MRVAERWHRRTAAAGAVVAVIIAVSLAGCAQDAAAPGGFTSSARPPRVILPVKLNPDGSVPWVNAPATSADFLTRPPPPPPTVGPACRARQLTAALSQWISGNVPGEPEDPVNRASLFGSVVLTNISDAPCTLSGTPSVRLLSSSGVVPLPYGKLGPTSTPKVGLPAGGHASFPLDWDGRTAAWPRARSRWTPRWPALACAPRSVTRQGRAACLAGPTPTAGCTPARSRRAAHPPSRHRHPCSG